VKLSICRCSEIYLAVNSKKSLIKHAIMYQAKNGGTVLKSKK
jgi:hypothetical protein